MFFHIVIFPILTVYFLNDNVIDYIEDFALSPNRSVVLKDLIPGTRDYYYYPALLAQNEGKHDKVKKLIGLWVKRHGLSALAMTNSEML